MLGGNERKATSSSSAGLDCDVGLGLKMQPSTGESYSSQSNKKAMGMGMALPFYNNNSCSHPTDYGGDGSSGGGGPFFSNQVSCGGDSDIYQAAVGLLPRTFHNNTALFRSSAGQGGEMAVSGIAPLFTASQLEELERQKAILSSLPLAPDFLLPVPGTHPLPHPPVSSQSNILDLRFPSSGSDPEPWRCKRTDGKKWRCSRDVVPDQKYCERHAHKNRPRSRKPVEVPSHNSAPAAGNNSPATAPPSRRPNSHFSTMSSTAAPYDQTRSIEWLMRGGSSSSIPVSTKTGYNQRQTSSRRSESEHDKNTSSSVYQSQIQQQHQGFMHSSLTDPYNVLENHQLNNNSSNNNNNDETCSNNSFLESLQGGMRSQQTRHFIDAWDKDKDTSSSLSFSKKQLFPPPSAASLSLSMSTGIYGNDQDLGIGTTNSEKDSDGFLMKSSQQWMNTNMNMNPGPVCWMMNPCPPGGPLGEALCLGNATTTANRGNIDNSQYSSHGYYSSRNNNTSKSSSCEDGSHALNFIG